MYDRRWNPFLGFQLAQRAQEMQNTLTLMEMHELYQRTWKFKVIRNLQKAI